MKTCGIEMVISLPADVESGRLFDQIRNAVDSVLAEYEGAELEDFTCGVDADSVDEETLCPSKS